MRVAIVVINRLRILVDSLTVVVTLVVLLHVIDVVMILIDICRHVFTLSHKFLVIYGANHIESVAVHDSIVAIVHSLPMLKQSANRRHLR